MVVSRNFWLTPRMLERLNELWLLFVTVDE